MGPENRGTGTRVVSPLVEKSARYVCPEFITSERAQRAQRVLSYLREESEHSRPDPTRPGPITIFKSLYLRNRMSDWQAVLFDEYHLDVKVVRDGYHIVSVPVMARGACQTWGTMGAPKTLYLNNCTTVGPIGLRLGIQLGTQRKFMSVGHFWGASERAHVHTPLLYLENGWTDCAEIWHVASGQLVMWLPHIYGVSLCTCARAHPTSIFRERLNRLGLDLACS